MACRWNSFEVTGGRVSVAGLLAVQDYPWAVIGTRPRPRLAGIAALAVAGGLSQLFPDYAAVGLVATVLLVLIVTVVRERDAGSVTVLIDDCGQAVAMR